LYWLVLDGGWSFAVVVDVAVAVGGLDPDSLPESELNDESTPELELEQGVDGLELRDVLNGVAGDPDPRYLPGNGVRCLGVEKGWWGCLE
jgi:hypothetical protein